MKIREYSMSLRSNLPLITGLMMIVILSISTSCRQKSVYESYHRITESAWNQDTVLVFDLTIPDPKKVYNLSFMVRNEGRYSYSNLWLFIAITPPTGKVTTDTLELALAKPTGEWLGSGLHDLYDRKYPYKQTIFFPEVGKYTISVRQGMRTPNGVLKGIHDFGVALDKAL